MVTVVVINAIIESLNQTLRVTGISNQALNEERDQLEKRSRDLERRETQIRTATQISRTISAQLDPEKLFTQVVELILERFDLYYVGIFLLDPGGEFAVLKAGTGEAGKAMLEAGHKLPVAGTSMIGWAVSRQQARIALDVGEDAVRFENPNLPYTRSELAIPMISGNQVLGAITIQSHLPNAFDKNDIVILEGIADSLAIAHENAILFKQIRSNLEEIHKLNQRYLADEWMEVVSTKGDVSYSFENKNYETIREEPFETIEKPLILRDQVMGQIILEGDSCSLDSEDETFIESVATQAVLALENIRLMESTQRSAHHNRVVAELSQKVWESTDMDTILRTTLYELAEALQASNGLIRLEIPQESDPSLPIQS
jgi:GAF domain-containing protein